MGIVISCQGLAIWSPWVPNGALGYRTAFCRVCKTYANSSQDGYRTVFGTGSMGTERGPVGTECHVALHKSYANSRWDGYRTLFAAGNTGTKLWRQCAKTLHIAGSMGVAHLTFSIVTSTQDALGIRLASLLPN